MILEPSGGFCNHSKKKKYCCGLPYIYDICNSILLDGTKGLWPLIRLLLRLPGDQADNLTKPRAKISFSNLTAKMTHMADVYIWRLVLSLSFLTVDFLHFFECVYICAKEGKPSPLDLNFFHGTFFSDQLTRERNGSAGKSVKFNQDWEKDYREK